MNGKNDNKFTFNQPNTDKGLDAFLSDWEKQTKLKK